MGDGIAAPSGEYAWRHWNRDAGAVRYHAAPAIEYSIRLDLEEI